MFEMLDINIPGGLDADRTDAHARHVRRGRVGAVSADRDHANIAPGVPPELVVALYRTQAGILALCTAVHFGLSILVVIINFKNIFFCGEGTLLWAADIAFHHAIEQTARL